MTTRHQAIRSLQFGALLPCILLAHGLDAEEKLTLLESSPFLPVDFNPPNSDASDIAAALAESDLAGYSFSGFRRSGEVYSFLLYNKRENTGFWITGDEDRFGVTIVDFNPENEVLGLKTKAGIIHLPLETTLEEGNSGQPQPSAQARRVSSPVRRRVVPPRPPGSSSSRADPARRPAVDSPAD